MTIKLSSSTAGRVDGGSNQHLIVALAQQLARIPASSVSALTDSSTGVASASRAIVPVPADLTNVPNASTNLASGSTSLAGLNAVKDALLELATKANAIATAIGADPLTYNGGGTAADGTVNAIGVTTAATTGAKATESNTSISALNVALADVAHFVNRLARATGKSRLVIDKTLAQSSVTNGTITVSALTLSTGTAADPGVTKAAFDAKLALYAANVATIAAKINDIRSAYVPEVVVVA